MSDLVNCQRVDVDGAAAVDLGSSRFILVWGTRPSPCYEPRVVPIKMPNTYEALLCERPGQVCIQMVGPYVGCLETNANAATSVTIIGPSGSKKVPVIKGKLWGDVLAPVPQAARTAWLGSVSAASGGAANAISTAAPVACEGVGISPTFSFDEAFQAAIRDAEPGPGYPDRLLTFTVQEVGARFGGIAGFRHMFVRVRCTSS